MQHHSKLQHLDLFSGIGGFSLGLEATGGFETKAFCDIEEYPRAILKKNWPHIKQYTDIKELTYEKLKSDGIESIDIITGGYPCQPFSIAGSKKGEEDPRHLWPEYFRLVKECRPTWVIGENVSGHIKLGLDTVLTDLESEGYSTRTFSLSASSIGANHQRERVWIVAYSDVEDTRRGSWGKQFARDKESLGQWTYEKTERSGNTSEASRSSEGAETLADTNSERGRMWQTGSQDAEDVRQSSGSQKTFGWWNTEPNVGRVAHGVSKRTHRLKSLGNSLIPQIPYYLGKSILEGYATSI